MEEDEGRGVEEDEGGGGGVVGDEGRREEVWRKMKEEE